MRAKASSSTRPRSALRIEFAGVKRTYLPMHYVLRIDEVDKQGVSKITHAEGGNVAQFPMPVYHAAGQGRPHGALTSSALQAIRTTA